MAAVTPILVAILLAPAIPYAPPAPDPVARWRPMIAAASRRYGVPVGWIERVMRAESGGMTTIGSKPIRSPTGAMGLMQLMPATWSQMRDQLHLGPDPDDPHDNIVAGVAYLRLMADRFGYPGLFAAYNAGPARYTAFLAGRRRLPDETMAYLNGIVGRPVHLAAPAASGPRDLLFALRRTLANDGQRSGVPASSDALFAIRQVVP